MVYCPSCSEQQDDVTKFCRFCGDPLPGADMMLKLRNEALSLTSKNAGNQLSEAQLETAKTISAIQANGNNGSTYRDINNGEHIQSTLYATNSLKHLKQDL